MSVSPHSFQTICVFWCHKAMEWQLRWAPAWSSRIITRAIVCSVASCGRKALWRFSRRAQAFKRGVLQRNPLLCGLTTMSSEVQVVTVSHNVSRSFQTFVIDQRKSRVSLDFPIKVTLLLSTAFVIFWNQFSCFHFYCFSFPLIRKLSFSLFSNAFELARVACSRD